MKRHSIWMTAMLLCTMGCSGTEKTETTPSSTDDGETDAQDSEDATDTATWPERERLDASHTHPTMLSGDDIPIEQVPMFIVLGFDDNGIVDANNNGGTTWILNYMNDLTNIDGSPARASFYMTGKYGAQYVYGPHRAVLQAWRDLHDAGHEIGVHSMEHLMWWNTVEDNGQYDGRSYTLEEWEEKEFDPVMAVLTTPEPDGAGISRDELRSWRTPRLEWNNALLGLLRRENFLYDCSIESDPSGDVQNEYWPFTLDEGCPWDSTVNSHPGLWELPAYRFHIPPELVEKAGTATVTGLDYNVWIKKEWGGLELTGPDFTDILKHNLDGRMAGNRSPLLIGLHSDIYTDLHGKNTEYTGTANARERQLAIENFLEYAIATYPEVRIVTGIDVVNWLKNPSPLE